MKLTAQKLTAQPDKTQAHKWSSRKICGYLRPVSAAIGAAALLAMLTALPACAEGSFPAPGTPLADITSPRPATPTLSPLATLTGVEMDETTLPSGTIRRTVRRVRTQTTDKPPLASAMALADNMLKMPLQTPVLAMRRQADLVGNPLSVDLRLGLSVSPRVKFVGGIDVRVPGLSLGPGFTTRADLDAVVSANFGGVSTLFPLTIDELYHADLPGGTGLYGGIGVGPVFGEVTRLGGKIIVGANITPRLRLEGNVLFAGYGDPLLNIQLRIPVL